MNINGRSIYGIDRSRAALASPVFTGAPQAPTPTSSSSATQIATKEYVDGMLAANDAMVFKGTLGSGGTITALPATHEAGWTYRVVTAGTYANIACEVGDLIICITDGSNANDAHWTVAQTNIDGAVIGPASSTAEHIATFTGITGKAIKDSGFTIATSVPANAVFTDTTYTSLTAASGGTAESLVTTGEKYSWDNKAPIASPTFTGIPTAPTAATGTSTTQVATTAFVQTAIAAAITNNTYNGSSQVVS